MRVGITVREGRVTSLFRGVILWVVSFPMTEKKIEVVKTDSWRTMEWGKELMRCDVEALLCGGIEQFVYGAIQGNGVLVIPNVTGDVNMVLKKLKIEEVSGNTLWPHCSRSLKNCRRGCDR